MTPIVLQLPGWQNSGAAHWQTRWQALHGDVRVEQHDWQTPKRGDWVARLEDVMHAQPQPVVLVAHSLGCHLVAAWAAISAQAARVRGALLVAPPDLLRADLPQALHGWRPPLLQRLPFAATVVTSSDDPFCSADSSAQLAQAWGAAQVSVGARGHVNGDSQLGDWPAGRALLQAWLRAA